MRIPLALIFVLSLAACQPMLRGPRVADGGGGSDVGSAGDNPGVEHLAAWLVDSRRKIHLCIEISPGFSQKREDIERDIRRAFWTWEDYIRIHHIYKKQPPELQLATEYTVDAACGADTDIAFYFGVENAAVERAKKQFQNPVAFIQPTEHHKGFIWVAENSAWKLPGRLQAILLHELGHAYGNAHVPGTIMTEQIVELLNGDWTDTELTSVDHCRELSPCLGCTYSTPVDEAHIPMAWLTKIRALPKKPYFAWLHRTETGTFDRLQLFAEGIERPLGDVSLHQVGSTRSAASGAGVFKVVDGNQVTQFFDTSSIRYLVANEIVGSMVLEYNLATCGKKGRGHAAPVKATFWSDKSPEPLGEFPFVYPR